MKKNIFLLIIILLAGCTAKDTKEETVPATVKTSQESVLSLALVGKTEFQPHSVSEQSTALALKTVYEPLFNEDVNGVYKPVLAKKLVNRGFELDIYIRDNVKWHDGTEFTVHDVVYTISIITGGYSVYKTKTISGAYASSDTCVTVILSTHISCPESILTFPIVKNNSPASMKYPIGTGKYCFKQKEAFDCYTFVPFEDYYASMPHFKKLQMIVARNKLTEKNLFMSGETDILHIESSDLTEYSPRKNSWILTYPTKHIIYIGFNNNTVSESIRRSVYYAVDRFKLTEKIFKNSAMASATPSEPARYGNSANDSNIFLSKNEVGIFKNTEYLLLYESGSGHKELALELSQILKNMGIHCKVYKKDDNQTNKNNYDIVIGTHKPEADFFDMLYKKEPYNDIFYKPHNVADINNTIVTNVPFIVVAYRCNALAVSGQFKSESVYINDLFNYGYDIID